VHLLLRCGDYIVAPAATPLERISLSPGSIDLSVAAGSQTVGVSTRAIPVFHHRMTRPTPDGTILGP